MKLSIVTITYNNLEGFKKTAASVLSQNYCDYEWIVIDGGSTDGTREYVASLERQPDYWCSEKDNGVYNAQNKGIAHARGEFVCCMNAGDTFHESVTLENVFKENIVADVIYGDWVNVMNGKHILLNAPKKITSFFFYHGNICHQAMFVRTGLMQKYPFDENFKVYADWKAWRNLIKREYRFEYVPVVVCDFEADNGLSAQIGNALKKEYRMLEEDTPADVLKDIVAIQRVKIMQMIRSQSTDIPSAKELRWEYKARKRLRGVRLLVFLLIVSILLNLFLLL